MENAPWSIVNAFDDMDDATRAFETFYKDIVRAHMPERKVKIRPFLSNKTKYPTTICIATDGGKVEKDQAVIAELLANYFSTAASSIGGDQVPNLIESDHDNHTSVKAIREMYDGNKFEFEQISTAKIQSALENINPRKSSGWDSGAPPKLLKIVAKGIAPSLTRLYNNCIEQSQWPHKWKMGEWTPVFKKGDRQADKNYRPITSLITVDKIFEHLLSKQITEHYDPTLYHRESVPVLSRPRTIKRSSISCWKNMKKWPWHTAP